LTTPKVFEVTVPDGTDPAAGFTLARQKAGGVGITLTGDTERGTFSGTAAGTYRRDGAKLTFEVTEKPFFVTWKMIESGLNKVFGAAAD